MMHFIVGIVPAPGFSEKITYQIKNRLEKKINEEMIGQTVWEIKVQTDYLTGTAEHVKNIMDQALHIKKENNWDYIISLTDLPILCEKSIVIADADPTNKIAHVSLPAFGALSTPRKVEKTIKQMLYELHYRGDSPEEDFHFFKKEIGVKSGREKRIKEKLNEIFSFSKIERKTSSEKKDDDSIRFVIDPPWSQKMKLLAGLTIANEPWGIMPSFKKVIGLAFATGSYVLIFTTLWELSGQYRLLRLIALMLLAIMGMVFWIIFAHNLWEKKKGYSSKRLRNLYNTTTVLTLSSAIIVFYFSLFILLLMAVSIFVPPSIFENMLNEEVGFTDYLKLAWLATSASTVAGAIGAGLENEEEVKRTAYGYRQYMRSKELERRKAQQSETE